MIIPIKKDGAEMPSTLLKTALLSIQVFFLMAANIPNNIPKIVATNIAAKARSNVPGMASMSISLTCFLL